MLNKIKNRNFIKDSFIIQRVTGSNPSTFNIGINGVLGTELAWPVNMK